MLHADGTPAQGPIALAETQGYVYYAKRRLAAIYGQLGDVERAERLTQEARALKRRFNERFWMEDEGFFAMALDGQKQQVRAVCSTIGHALWSRIVADEHVPAVVKRLMAPDMFTGWGVRTFSKAAERLQPGELLQRQRVAVRHGAHRQRHEEARLRAGVQPPRLGARGGGRGARVLAPPGDVLRLHAAGRSTRPVAFPMACSPDAASSGALFLILQSMLGIYAQAEENIVYVHNPALPKWLGEVTLSATSGWAAPPCACASAARAGTPASRCSTSRGRGVSWW